MQQDIKSCIQVLILCHLEPHGPNLKHNPIDVGGDTFQVKTGVSQQLWDMSSNKIRAVGPIDLKLTFSERKLKELSENINFYPPPLMYSCYATFFRKVSQHLKIECAPLTTLLIEGGEFQMKEKDPDTKQRI